MASKREPWTPPPVTTPEAREEQLIVLATDLAEQQLREGVASAAVIVHYLKASTEREKLEREKLKREGELLRSRVEALESAKDASEKYEKALSAMRQYQGVEDELVSDSDEYY